jgi:thiol-disulfide isomerase/thioredoxin
MKILRFLALLWFAGTAALALAAPGEVPVGGQLREAELHGLTVADAKLSAYRGKPLIINVWASWCGPCHDEMGSLDRLAQRYGGKQFNVIGISTADYRDRALGFMRESRTRFPNYIDSQLFMENMLGASRIPLTLLVDSRGTVLARFYGTRDWDSKEAHAVIAKAFKIGL